MIESTVLVNWTPATMLEVSLQEPDDFLKIRETLSRIGVSSKREANVLFQSCHLLHKSGRYFLVHFKEMFILDGKPSSLIQNDLARRNTIATLLSDWGLLSIVKPDQARDKVEVKQLKIVSFKDKPNWRLETKYTMGKYKSCRTSN